jgi:alkylhydroperoxidase/carboxymuconolactone decarboxylase family protein YurZ
LRFHFGKAVENGVKEQELIEAMTHSLLGLAQRYERRHDREGAIF